MRARHELRFGAPPRRDGVPNHTEFEPAPGLAPGDELVAPDDRHRCLSPCECPEMSALPLFGTEMSRSAFGRLPQGHSLGLRPGPGPGMWLSWQSRTFRSAGDARSRARPDPARPTRRQRLKGLCPRSPVRVLFVVSGSYGSGPARFLDRLAREPHPGPAEIRMHEGSRPGSTRTRPFPAGGRRCHATAVMYPVTGCCSL